MEVQLTTTQWLTLPQPVRSAIAKAFGVPRSSFTHVQDGVVTSDGYTHPDLANITVPKMQAYMKSESTDFFHLFDQVLERVTCELAEATPPAVAVTQPVKVIVLDGKTYIATEVSPDQFAGANKMVKHEAVPMNVLVKNKGGRPKGSKNKPK